MPNDQTAPNLTASDADTGITVHVAEDQKTVIAKDRDGKVLWKQDIVQTVGAPSVGSPTIRQLSIEKRGVQLILGKHTYVLLSLKTGRILSTASD